MMSERILCVDDDPNVLEAFRRRLRRDFRIETAQSAEEALRIIQAGEPYAVIVSDMRMPGMDGVQFLAKARTICPDTVRIMLTGNADQQTAIEAVNEGAIFRFLTKPCEPETLARALTAGLEQYRLITAEKELLEKTLRGSVKVLTEVLALVNPTAFGRASRVQRLVRELAAALPCEVSWELDVAAMLSQIGCVTLPPETLDRLYQGQNLTPEETRMFEAHPGIGRQLVANIPRLEGVAEVIAYQEKHFDGTGVPSDERRGTQIPLGARILKVALDFEALRSHGLEDLAALARLRERAGWYDPDVLRALTTTIGKGEPCEVREVRIRDLTGQMIFAEDVRTVSGLLVVCKGQEATTYLRERLKNYSQHTPIREPIRVVIRREPTPAPTAASARAVAVGR